MKKLLWIVCLAATAAFPAAARADGIAFAGVAYGGSGVASLDERLRYVTLPLPHRTMVLKIDARGSVLAYRPLPGSWGIPMVAFDGSTSGISADGRTLVLTQPPIGRMRKVSRFPIIRTKTLRHVETVTLRGSFSFDALSPDGKTLYVIEHVNRRDVAEYQVRAYDIPRERLLPYAIRDHNSSEVEMYGYPRSRATSPDGRWAYTLYEGGHHSFVHALDTVERTAVCVDLPMDTPPDHVADARLVVGPGGETLTVDSPSGGTIAVVDTRTLSLRPEPTEQSAARAAAPPSPAEEHAQAPAWLPWAVLAGALALIAVAFGARRVRRRVSPGTSDATPGRDRPGLAHALSERTRPHHLDAGVNGARKATARVL